MSRAALIALLVASALGGSLSRNAEGRDFMATLPDPRTQVLPDGAAFRVSAFSNPCPFKTVRTAATPSVHILPLMATCLGTSDRMVKR
jgi:hypothetical protein